MDQLLKKIEFDEESLSQMLDFLPYPFILSNIEGGIRRNLFVNQKFSEEIGYSTDEIGTLESWFQTVYPDRAYRQEVKAEWRRREVAAKNAGRDSIVMNSKIRTKYGEDIWYEVKASIYGPTQFVAFININEEVLRKEELLRLNETQNRVLSILSHDLRTPINSLRSIILLNENGMLSDEEKQDLFKKLGDHVFQLGEFLDTTLQWAKLNFSSIKSDRQLLDIPKITQSILNLYMPSIVHKNIQMHVSLENNRVMYGDPEVVSIVFRNLLSNAIKFTPAGGDVKVYDVYRSGKYFLSVENSGAGISPEKINAIYGKDCLSEKGTMDEKGLGMGLKLCLQLLRNNSYELEIESQDGQRTVFRMVI